MSVNGNGKDDKVNKAKGSIAGLDELDRIAEAAKQQTVHELKLHERREVANELLEHGKWQEEFHQVIPREKGMAADHHLKSGIRDQTLANKTIESTSNQLDYLGKARIERLNQRTVNAISGTYSESAINGMVASSQNDPEIQQRGTGLAKEGSWEALQAKRGEIFKEIGGLRQANVQRAANFIGPNGASPQHKEEFAKDAEALQGLIAQVGPINAALKQHKTLGNDPESRQLALIKKADEAQGIVGFSQLKDDIKSGKNALGGLSKEDLGKKEVEASQKLLAAMAQLAAGAGGAADKLAELNKNAEVAATELKDIQDARAAGGGGGRSGSDKVASAAGIISGIASAIAGGIQAIGVNQPMAQMGNAAGYANIENQKYDMLHAAVAGDMTARLNLRGWDAAQGFGGRMAENTGYRMVAEGAGAVANTVQGGALAWGTGGLMGTGEMANGLAQTATLGMDALRHVSTSQAEISGINASMGATKQINHISGHQLQGFRDYSMGMMGVAGQMGSKRGSAMLDEVLGDDHMREMKFMGLGTKEMAALSGQGVQQMGSMFNGAQPLQAQRFVNLGLGSATENMGRMAALSAGGQNPSQSLEKLLEQAVGAGLDSSKTQTMIAEHTGQLVEKTAMGGGPDVSDAASKYLVGLIDNKNPNQELATKQAMAGHDTNAAILADRGANFSTMMSVSNLVGGLGMSAVSATNAQTMSYETLETIRGTKDKEEQERLFLMGSGVDVHKNKSFQKDPSKFIDYMESTMGDKLLRQGGPGMANGSSWDFDKTLKYLKDDPTGERREAYESGKTRKDMPEDVIAQRVRTVEAAKLISPNDPSIGLKQIIALKLGAKDKAVNPLGDGAMQPNVWQAPMLPDTLPPAQDAYGSLRSDYVQAGKQEVDTARQGGTVLGGSKGTERSQGLAASAEAVAQANPGELALAAAAAQSAKDFGESATRMNIASDKLGVAADKLLILAGVIELAKIERDKTPNGLFPSPDGGGNIPIDQIGRVNMVNK